MPSMDAAVSSPEKNVLPATSAASAAACGGLERESHTRTRAPWPAHQRAMARPEAPSPRISTFLSDSSFIDSSTQLQAGEADEAHQHGDDPETDHDLRLGPAGLLEMVVQRRHLQDAPALAVLALGVLEPAHLRHHRQRFHHEHATHDPEDDFLARDH